MLSSPGPMRLMQAIRRFVGGPVPAPPALSPGAAATAKIRPRIGILFVHGMGEQARGDTLTQMGDAVSEWIRRAVQDDDGVDFSIRHAILRSSDHGPTDDEVSLGATAHVTIRIADRRDASRSQEWLLAESWWADVFRPATFGETAIWAIAVGPSVITGQLVNLVRRLVFEDQSWMQGNLVSLVLLVPRLIVAVVLTLAALAAAALLTPLAIGLFLLSLVPIPFVSGFAKGVSANLAASFGDLLVLVRSPIRFAAMAERVKQDIDAVGRQSDEMFVVAHSQGSAVAWHAIRRVASARIGPGGVGMPSTLSRFVSFGQALRKLKALYLFSTEGEPWRTVATVLAGVITLFLAGVAWLLGAALITALTGGTPDPVSAITVTYLLAGAVALLVPLAVIVWANELSAQKKIGEEIGAVRGGLGDAFEWVDLWASADPAPNGPLLDELPAGVTSYRIRNSASILLDHSTYWSNVTEFVSAIVLLAAHRTGPPGISARAWVPERLREAARTRDRRAAMVAVARIVFFTGLFVGFVAFADRLADLGVLVTERLQGIPILPDWFEGWSDFAHAVVGVFTATVVALFGWAVLGWLRSGVDRLDQRAFFAGTSGWVAEVAAWAWLGVAIAAPWVVMILLGLELDPLPAALWWHVGTSIALIAMWWILQRGGSALSD